MNTRDNIEEVAVRELETILKSPEEVNKWLDEISQNQEVKNNWQKFVEWINKIFDDIKRALAQLNMTAEEKADVAEVEHILSLLTDAVKVAEKTATELSNKTDAKQDTTEANNSTEAKNEGNTKKEVSYSFNESFGQQLEDWREGKGKAYGTYNGNYFELGTTPDVLVKHGAPKGDVIMFEDCLLKIAGLKHSIALDELAKIPSQLNDPILLFKGSIKNSFVALTELKAKNGHDVIVAIHLNKKQGRTIINKIASVYSKTSEFGENKITDYVTEQIKQGNLLDASIKKAPIWFTASGLQLPHAVQTIIAAKSRIPQNPKSVKSDFSLIDDEYLKAVESGDTETASKMVEEAAEKAFPNSKVRGDNGKLKYVYHGTVSDFRAFDRQFANIEGDFGKGYYFTSNEYDVDANYANEEGPDLKNKIALLAERLEWEDEYADLSYGEREEIARERLVTSEPHTITAYLNMENPVYINPNENGTFLDFTEEYDEEFDEYGEPEGLLIDFVEALNEIASDYAYNDVDFSFLYEYAYDNGGVHASDAVKTIKHRITDELTDDNGNLAINEVIRLAFEKIGFDGIIDSSVYYKFRNMSGMDSGTTHYIVFNSEQIKSADITTYDENGDIIPLSERFNKQSDDINFSLIDTVEETKDLIAVHNVREDKLLESLKLGGLPSPSIAITKKDMSHDKFGDISLVFRKETISPTDRRNKIYSGDAYTPTSVRVEYDVDDDVVQEFNKRLKDLTPEWGSERLPSVDAGTADVKNDSLYEAYERNDRAKLAFLREKGKAPKLAMRTPRLSTFVSNDTVIALAKAFSAKQLNDIANTSEGVKQYKNAFLKVIRDNEDSRFVETGIYSADEASLYDIAETARTAARIKENKYKIKKEVDNRETYKLIDKKFTKALKEEYRTWIDENTKDAIVDKGIRNNRDLFTPSGSRRSFKQLHDPYNLSNIVKQMFSGEEKGIALFGGSPFGAAQYEYSSIADVKADSGRLQQLEQEEHDKIKSQIEDDLFELAYKMQINSDVFAIRDLLTEAIGKKTKQQADAYLRRESQGWAKYSPEFTNELWDIRTRILNMPTEYFEAKPQRAVGFNEVALAVLPKGMSTLRSQLMDAGVQKVVYYDKNKEGDRLKKINSVPDVNFSLIDTEPSRTTSKDTKALLETIEHLKNEFKVTKFAKADPKKLAKMTKDLLKEYSSKGIYDETYKAIDELYQYIANGEDGHPAVWDDVYSRASEIAKSIVESAVVVDDEMYTMYKDLRDYLHKTPMKFDSNYDSVPSGYENFREFKRRNFGSLNFTKDGVGVDGIYQELAGLYPEFFNAEEQTNVADQLEQIVDVLDELKPREINPHSQGMRQAISYLANDIIDRFFDIPQAKPTFADKAERRVMAERVKGNKKVEAVRQQKDEQIQKLIERQRDKTKKQIEKLREQRDARVRKEQQKRREAIAKMSETQKAKVLRTQIARHASDLSKKLLRPTDNQHIPEDLKGVVAKLLECINLESNYSYHPESHSYKKDDKGLPTRRTQAFNELKKLYGKISSSVVVDPNLLGDDGMLSDVISLADKRIADMTSEELTKIYDTILIIEHTVSTAGKMFALGKWERINDAMNDFASSVANRKAKNPILEQQASLDIETPSTFFSHFGDAGNTLFELLLDAQDNERRMKDEFAELSAQVASAEYVENANKELYEFETIAGKKVTLSKAHIINLYLLSKRPHGLKHILGGGIHQPKAGKIKRDSKSMRITQADLNNIFSKLTEEDKIISTKLQNTTKLLAQWGNKASMKVFGYEKFKDPDYWTIKTAEEGRNQSIETDDLLPSTLKNMGSGKPLNEQAQNAIDVDDAFVLLEKHALQMIRYAAWLEITEDVNRMYNYEFKDEFGFKTGESFKSILDDYAGTGGKRFFFNLISDIQNGVKNAPDTNIEKYVTKIYNNATKASVAHNIRVVIQQPTSLPRAAMVLSDTSIMAATAKGITIKSIYDGWQEALKYSPIASQKANGGYDINTNDKNASKWLFKPETAKGKLKNSVEESSFWLASKMDEMTWGIIWNACKIEINKNNNFEIATQTFELP